MSSPLHPSEGIRMLLERVSIEKDASRAGYSGKIYTPLDVYFFEVVLSMDGSATIGECLESSSEDPIEEGYQKSLLKLCKSIARASKRKLQEQLPPWPPRILRWRGPGR